MTMRLLLAMAGLALAAAARAGEDAASYRWKHEEGKALTLLREDETLWALHYARDAGKPYFHPLCLADGMALTWLRPPDHIWHRALWFSWKFINKLNYWEENKEGLSPGRNRVVDATIETGPQGSAAIVLRIHYHPPGKPPVLEERRHIAVSPPDAAGPYRMDWRMTFTARDQDVTLDRTPPKKHGGPAWGGYGGLSYRAAKAMSAFQVLNSRGQRDMAGHGQTARWMDFSGVLGPDDGRAGGVAMLDHPSNPRHPSPWFIVMRGHFGYFGPAFLFEEPYVLEAGESLTLRYRVLVHPGRPDRELLEAEYRDFAASK
ncbi:MAG: PmoA family protein [Candidatus Brocadiia bacterium]